MFSAIASEIRAQIQSHIDRVMSDLTRKMGKTLMIATFVVVVVLPIWVFGMMFLMGSFFLYLADLTEFINSALVAGVSALLLSVALFFLGLIVFKRV